MVRSSRPGAFIVNFQNMDLRLVLRLLSTQGRRNIVATKEVTGSVTATFYDVTFAEALEAILSATGCAYLEKDNFIYVYTAEQIEKILKVEQKLHVRTFRLCYVTAKDTQILIQPALSDDGTVAVAPAAAQGVAPDTEATGGDSYAVNDVMVVRDYEENLEMVAKIIEELDIRPPQVLIEATILSARLDEANDLGINFNSLSGVDFESLGAASTGVGSVPAGSIATTEMKGMRAAQFRTAFDTVSGGMTIGFLSNNTAFFITALEKVTDLTVLANPKLLVVNKQRGEVMIGSRDGYKTTVVNQGVSQENIEFLETGIKLIVRPYVGKDGFVRLEVHPEDSDGSITDGLPRETTTHVTTNVLIRDGHTLVVGGLFRDEVKNEHAQVPGLGNIPHIGKLLQRTDDTIERREVIILITPHIIRHAPDEGASEQVMDDVERFRVGQRKGLQWWGRGQLAHSHVRWARTWLHRGRTGRALWDLDLALAMDPRLLEAIRLKEHLTGRAYWSDDVQVSACAYLIERMIMQELKKPVDLVTPPHKPLDNMSLDRDIRKARGMMRRYDRPLSVPGRNEAKPSTRQEVKVPPDAADDNTEAGEPPARKDRADDR